MGEVGGYSAGGAGGCLPSFLGSKVFISVAISGGVVTTSMGLVFSISPSCL